MIKVDGGATATYTYDAFGRRVRSVNTGGRTRECSFDQGGNCVAEFDAYSWAWIRSDIRAFGEDVATGVGFVKLAAEVIVYGRGLTQCH